MNILLSSKLKNCLSELACKERPVSFPRNKHRGERLLVRLLSLVAHSFYASILTLTPPYRHRNQSETPHRRQVLCVHVCMCLDSWAKQSTVPCEFDFLHVGIPLLQVPSSSASLGDCLQSQCSTSASQLLGRVADTKIVEVRIAVERHHTSSLSSAISCVQIATTVH